MLLLLDNFDSFTYNLYDYLGRLGAECKVFRNDCKLSELKRHPFGGVVLSPGPAYPQQAGNLLEVLDFYVEKLPILGICLGHQAIGEYFGASLEKAQKPMHGKISSIQTQEDALFQNLPPSFDVVRYNSLILNKIQPPLEAIAQSETGENMAIRHRELPIRGVQFHPEAACTQFGLELLRNWLAIF